jgi:hypothetical protein
MHSKPAVGSSAPLPNHLAMPSLIMQNSHTHETSLMRQRNLKFALTQSEMRCSVRAAFARYALRHFHNPSIGSQRRSIAAASFQLLPFLNLTEEPKMVGMRSGLVIFTALLLSGSAALAQQEAKPCASDIKTLCAGIQPGEGRIKACIKSHLTNLSQTCENRVLTVAVTRKVCKTDLTKLCAGVMPGTGGIRACIKSHMAEVSDPCRDAMSQTAAGKKIFGGGDL